MRTLFALPYPFGARRGAAVEVDARTTTPGVAPLIGRDDPASFEPNRPGPRSPFAAPVHPYLGRAMGLALDGRALAKLWHGATLRVAPRVTLSVGEQERQRGLRAVVSRLRSAPTTYATPYNAAPLGRAGTAIARPLPGMGGQPAGDLPCVDCR